MGVTPLTPGDLLFGHHTPPQNALQGTAQGLVGAEGPLATTPAPHLSEDVLPWLPKQQRSIPCWLPACLDLPISVPRAKIGGKTP